MAADVMPLRAEATRDFAISELSKKADKYSATPTANYTPRGSGSQGGCKSCFNEQLSILFIHNSVRLSLQRPRMLASGNHPYHSMPAGEGTSINAPFAITVLTAPVPGLKVAFLGLHESSTSKELRAGSDQKPVARSLLLQRGVVLPSVGSSHQLGAESTAPPIPAAPCCWFFKLSILVC